MVVNNAGVGVLGFQECFTTDDWRKVFEVNVFGVQREARQFSPREFRIIAAPAVIELFLDEESQHLAELSDFVGKPISLQSESSAGQEQYDVVLM